jgi:hypothetical protein
MTINQRVEDAEFLWDSGRHEGAFLMALVGLPPPPERLTQKKDLTARRLIGFFRSSSALVSR